MRIKKELLLCNNSIQNSLLCGIDEAGRGPIAGDLVFAGVILEKQVYKLKDSKKLSEKEREKLFDKIKLASKFHIYTIPASRIDEQGLSLCIKEALLAIRSYFGEDVAYLYDGNSSFGVENIQTLVKADEKVKEVSAASILAKVHRDNLMKEYDKLYPEYGFAKHKGYGTKAHLEAIKKYGYCPIHRKSFKPKALYEQKSLFD